MAKLGRNIFFKQMPKKTVINKLIKSGIEIEVKKSKLAKRQRITISAKGVKVVAPYLSPNHHINSFIDSNLDWIKKKYSELGQVKKQRLELVDNGKLQLFGEDLTIKISPQTAKKPSFLVNGSYLYITANPNLTQKELLNKFINWLKEELEVYLDYKINIFAKELKLSPKRIFIKRQKSLWGSCSHQGNLNFNLALIFCKKELIDYVIVHEMCHLKHLNHSTKFWKLVESIIPDYKLKRKKLKGSGKIDYL